MDPYEDLMGLLDDMDNAPQLDCIDELINLATGNEKQVANDVLEAGNIDNRKGGEVLDELGFEGDVDTKSGDIQEDFDEILGRFKQQIGMNCDAGHNNVAVRSAISIPRADIRGDRMSDTKFAPRTRIRKKPCPWTIQEHRQMKAALKDGLMGQWTKVSRLYIPTKTPAQITSHAQKYLKRRNNTQKKRRSIHDDDGTDDDVSYEVGPDQPSLLPPTRPDIPHVNTEYHHDHDHQQVHHDLMMVNQSPLQSQSPTQLMTSPTPLMTPPTPLMTPPAPLMIPTAPLMTSPPYDAATLLYYANQYRLLERQQKMVMMAMLKFREDMAVARSVGGPSGFLPGDGYSSNNRSFGSNCRLEPYNNLQGAGPSNHANY